MHRLSLAVLIGTLAAPTAMAQATRQAAVGVRVTDSVHVAIAGAEVAIVRGLSETLARGVTDTLGRRVLAYDAGVGDVEVVVRKIGYARADRYLRAKAGDTIRLEITLGRTAQALETVKVTDREDVRRRSYFIDADEIANTKRPLYDARDIIAKLRPDMIASRAGPRTCPPAQYVWVNGVRIRYASRKDALIASKRMARYAARATPHSPISSIDALPVFVASVLSDIKAEHIAEVSFHDCFDSSLGRIGGESAIFVVLKPGIGFEQGVGSYVSDAGVVQANDETATDSTAADAISLPSYRHRVLGVFDEDSGEPVQGVSVIDAATETRAATTVTGTVSLVFLREGVNTIRLEKNGYLQRTLEVTISPRDTVPITLILGRPKTQR